MLSYTGQALATGFNINKVLGKAVNIEASTLGLGYIIEWIILFPEVTAVLFMGVFAVYGNFIL